jgi:hypothetical protein
MDEKRASLGGRLTLCRIEQSGGWSVTVAAHPNDISSLECETAVMPLPTGMDGLISAGFGPQTLAAHYLSSTVLDAPTAEQQTKDCLQGVMHDNRSYSRQLSRHRCQQMNVSCRGC